MKIAARPFPWFSIFGLLLLLAPGLARPAAAGIDRFTPFGPMNGRFEALVVDPHLPTALLAAVDQNGVFRSDDAGRTWAWSGIGLGTALPQALAADPAISGAFYAISASQAFRSDDGGRTWLVTASGQDFTMPFVSNAANGVYSPQLAVVFPASPRAPATPATPATLLAGTGQHLQRSADGGATWSTVATAVQPATAWSIAVDPADPRRVWAGLYSTGGAGGLLASVDAGLTWNPVASYPDPFSRGAAALIVLPAPPGQPATLLTASGGGYTDEPIFKSTDDGATWRPVALPMEGVALTALAYEPQTPSIVYAASATALYVSSDAGETWQLRGAGIYPQVELGALVAAPGTRTVYGFATNDLVVSADRGRHWSITAQSGRETSPPRFHFLPGDPATIYLAFGESAWKSTNGGATWASFGTQAAPPQRLPVNDVAVDPVDPRILYLATQTGIFRTADSGKTWSLLAQVQFNQIQLVGRRLTFGTDCGVQRSTDGGKTWKRTLSCAPPPPRSSEGSFVDRLLLAPREPGVVYAQLLAQIWKSADGGATWKEIVPDGYALALDPERAGRLYASRLAGFERSDNGGRSFRLLSVFTAVDLTVDPVTPTTLYDADGQGGIYRSTDGGVTWETINAGLPRFVSRPWNATDVIVNPAIPHLLYAAVGPWILENHLSEP